MRVLPFAKTMYNDNMITFVSQAPWVSSSTIPGYYRLDLEKKKFYVSPTIYTFASKASGAIESNRTFFVDVRERNLRAESNGHKGRTCAEGRFFLNPEILVNKRS